MENERTTPPAPSATDATFLGDGLAKLVFYNIVSLEPGHERVLPQSGGTVMVTEPMRGEDFASWRIRHYLDSQTYRDLEAHEKLRPGEKKYLRVDFSVSRRWPKEALLFEKHELRALEGIREALGDDLPGSRGEEST